MRITKALRKFEYAVDLKTEAFFWHHPVLGFLFAFIGMPLFVLLGVCVSTIAITFPMAWVFGWL